MLFLKAMNFDDIELEYEYITNLPADENGFMNKYSNISYDEFKNIALPEFINNSNGINLKPNHVACTEYFLWNDNEIVGLFRLRHYLNDNLKNGSGHIGYQISPKHRNKGYATKGLELIIKIAKEIIPENEIYLSVNKNNHSSLKVQIKNGAYIHHENEDHFFTRIKIK